MGGDWWRVPDTPECHRGVVGYVGGSGWASNRCSVAARLSQQAARLGGSMLSGGAARDPPTPMAHGVPAVCYDEVVG